MKKTTIDLGAIASLKVGDACSVNHHNGYAGNSYLVGPATVTKITRKQIEIRNARGGLSRYWLATAKSVGSADPFDYYYVGPAIVPVVVATVPESTPRAVRAMKPELAELLRLAQAFVNAWTAYEDADRGEDDPSDDVIDAARSAQSDLADFAGVEVFEIEAIHEGDGKHEDPVVAGVAIGALRIKLESTLGEEVAS